MFSKEDYQRLANNEALLNYSEYADRFSSIKKLKKMFDEAGVEWALAYSTDLFLRGLIDDFHDLDIWVQDDLPQDELARLIKENNIELVRTDNDSLFTTKYFFTCKDGDTGVQIEFVCTFGMKVNQIQYDYLMDSKVEYLRVGNTTLPVIDICDLYILYIILEDSWQAKRRYKRELIEKYIKENMSPVKFDFLENTQFPKWIWDKVKYLEE